jgi:hypothetical protein
MAEPPPAARFPTTHWSCVVSAADPAAPGAKEALAELCAGYWYPLYAFIRRQGQPPEAAADLIQDYFARLLEKGALAAADQSRGRFRAFLRTDCGFFLAHRRDHEGDPDLAGVREPAALEELPEAERTEWRRSGRRWTGGSRRFCTRIPERDRSGRDGTGSAPPDRSFRGEVLRRVESLGRKPCQRNS